MNEIRREYLIKLRGAKKRPEVAKSLGITPQALGNFERGQRTPSLILAKKIADYYGVSLEDIFFNHDRHKSFPSNHTA